MKFWDNIILLFMANNAMIYMIIFLSDIALLVEDNKIVLFPLQLGFSVC